MLYGSERQKISTVAANYADAMRNPVLFLDNVESDNVSESLRDFFLVASSGISNEKRSIGTESGVTIETVKCLTSVTSIEPLCPDKPEILNRTLTVEFNEKNHKETIFNDVDLVEDIKRNRNNMFSAIFKVTAKVLELINKNYHKDALVLISESVSPRTQKHKRCFPYMSLAYLTYLTVERPNEVGNPDVVDSVCRFDEIDIIFNLSFEEASGKTLEAGIEGDPIVAVFEQFLNTQKKAHEANTMDIFVEKYGINFNNNKSEWVKTNLLLAAMRRIARDFNLSFKIKNAAQLGVRLRNLEKFQGILERKKDTRTRNNLYRFLFAVG